MARRAASMGLRAQVLRDASPTPPETGAEDEEVTRCLCGNQDFVQTARTRSLHAVPGLYVQCERCNVWQHGFCMGFSGEEDIPNEYYCELCEPSFHHITTKHGLTRSTYAPPSEAGETRAEEATSLLSHTVPLANGENHTEIVPETNTTHSPPSQSAVSSPSPPSEPMPPKPEKVLREDTRKRRSRPSSDEPPYLRNRKQRRSREDEILQRVLEESAREAREAESRRRSQDGSHANAENNEIAIKEDSPDNFDPTPAESGDPASSLVGAKRDNTPPTSSTARTKFSAEGDDETRTESAAESSGGRTRERTRASDATKPANSQRRATSDASSSQTSKTGTENSRKNMSGSATPNSNTKNGAASNTNTTGRRRQRATRNVSNGTASTATASPRRNGGTRRSKMRTPSQRSTLNEMRRRVAAILDFSSRTQDELIDDQKTRIIALQPVDMSSEDGVRYEQLLQLSQTNLGHLEDLTSQLLKWEEQFGISSP